MRDRLGQAYRAIRNARTNHLHQVSAAVVKSHALIAVKDTTQKEAARGSTREQGLIVTNSFTAALADTNPGRIIEKIRYKAEKAGGVMITVDPQQSLQDCHFCGIVAQKIDAASWQSCACGADLHRGHNAALNILARGLAAHAAAKRYDQSDIMPATCRAIRLALATRPIGNVCRYKIWPLTSPDFVRRGEQRFR